VEPPFRAGCEALPCGDMTVRSPGPNTAGDNGAIELRRLIFSRTESLGISLFELGARLGYRNPNKAIGRVQALLDGHIDSAKSRRALARLAGALEVGQSKLDEMLAAARANLAARAQQAEASAAKQAEVADAEWRATFKPHTVWKTERRVPTQVTICALLGGPARFLWTPLDATKPAVTFVRQSLKALPARATDGIRRVPFFGEVSGFVVNYRPDRAVYFDLAGKPVEALQAAYRVGQTELVVASRPTPVGQILGFRRAACQGMPTGPVR
jgi:hypothetical protein